jgi:serine/threonine protein kinase
MPFLSCAPATAPAPAAAAAAAAFQANSDASLAARLTWQRRLRMALDAAKGLVHLHNHKPTILHRDLKSPNLFVMTNYTVKVSHWGCSSISVVPYMV